MEKYNWFKNKIDNSDEDSNVEDKAEDKLGVFKTRNRKWGHYRKKKAPIEALEEENASKIEEPVQHTANSELASEARKVIQTLRPWTKINLKVLILFSRKPRYLDFLEL